MTQKYYFRRLRVSSKQKTSDALEFHSRQGFLEALNNWNRQGEGVWVYWEIASWIYAEEHPET